MQEVVKLRKFLKPLFSKMTFGAVLLFIQIALIVMTIGGLYEGSIYIDIAIKLLSVVVLLFEINRDADSGYKLIWIAIIAAFPVFGVFLYIYVHGDVIMRYIRRRLGKLSVKMSRTSNGIGGDLDDVYKNAAEEYGIFNYLAKTAYAPCFKCGDLRYFSLGDDMYESLILDVKSAKKYIFLEFFIINEADGMWKRLLDALRNKVNEGVEVRLIYDAMGSLTCVSSNFDKRLRSMGIKCYAFSPVKPFVSTYHNNRDHRKIVIIDGRYAYTGGINIADEYINQKKRFGHWKDTAVRIEGEGVKGFLPIFFKLWELVSASKEEYSRYFKGLKSQCSGEGFMAAFDDTPMDSDFVTRNIYLHMINSAKNYVYINTPYLILDDALSQALKFAASRGVDVRIMMPHIPDKWYAFAVGRSYYPELIKAGVRIYEYTPGFLHAKSTVSDDCRAYIGSANYDFRSLYLHYECGIYVYKNKIVSDIKEDFLCTLNVSAEVTLEVYKKLGFFYRLIGRALRFFAALM